MKNLVILILIFVANCIYANEVIYTYGDTIAVYCIETSKTFILSNYHGIGHLTMGKCRKKDSKYILSFYDTDQYYNRNHKFLIEKTLIIENEMIIHVYEDTIYEKINYFFDENIPDANVKSSYDILDILQPQNEFVRTNGDLIIKRNGEEFMVKKSTVCDKYKIGYFQPQLSFNKKIIVCTQMKGKYDWRKIKEYSIIEIDIVNMLEQNLNIKGWCVGFSTDDRYILCFDGYHGYNNRLFFLFDMKQRIKIKNIVAKDALWLSKEY